MDTTINTDQFEKIISSGIDSWNAFHSKNSKTGILLNSVSVEGYNLSGAIFDGVFLEEGLFVNCIFNNCTFAHTWIRGSTFKNCDFSNVEFDNTFVFRTSFKESDFTGARFRKVNMTESNFMKTSFEKSQVYESFFSQNYFEGARFNSARLDESDFSKSSFENAVFKGASINRVNFFAAILNGVDLSVNSKVLLQNRLSFRQAEMRDVKMWEADLRNIDFRQANLTEAFLGGSWAWDADFSGVIAPGIKLDGARLNNANFEDASLPGANFHHANLTSVNLKNAVLTGADLTGAQMISTNIENADLTGCFVHGISTWDLSGEPKSQRNLVTTRKNMPALTVDNIEVAQFIYLLLNRQKLRDVITTMTSKGVLILGRFTPERKAVLELLANELRNYDLLPIIFDFEKAESRDITETVKILAGLCFFVIVDITNPKSAPLELQATVPDYQIPFITIIEEGEQPFSMFQDLFKYRWIANPVSYASAEKLKLNFKKAILIPAQRLNEQILREKQRTLKATPIEHFDDDNGQGDST